MAPGGPGRGGIGGNSAAPDFRTPAGAVTAFLNALKARNKDQLTEATAKRAPTEAIEKHRKLFSEIIDGSISDDDLEEIAKQFDGFRVSMTLDAKSTGKIGVVVTKSDSAGGYLQSTFLARKEKDGWKVLDVEKLLDFKALMQSRRNGKKR